MSKILLLSDSASDITIEKEKELGCVRILNLPLFIDGETYYERVDLTADEFYQRFNNSKEVPCHAALNLVDFVDAFKQAAEEGVEDLIYLGINGKGSSTYNTSIQAKALFWEEHPKLAEKMNIYLVDGRCYSLGYGFPLVVAARMVNEGKSAREVIDYIVDFIDYRMEYVVIYTLQHAKKSGRIGAMAAFMGEMLGVKPIMGFPDGENKIHEKVRGEHAVVPRLFELYKNEIASYDEEYAVVVGEDDAPANELIQLIEEFSGKSPTVVGKIGACVTCNSGPKLVGITFRTRNPGHYTATVN